MQTDDQIYRKLQIHLDKMPVGFPSTDNGSDIRVLKAFFKPEEAKMALFLDFNPDSLENIYAKTQKNGHTMEETERILDSMVKNRIIIGWQSQRTNVKYYRTEQFALGFFEWALNRLNKEKAEAAGEYWPNFIREFLGEKTGIPQTRTIPLNASITNENNIMTYDNVKELIEAVKGPLVVSECICSQQKALAEGKSCEYGFTERCIQNSMDAVERGDGRIITKKELNDILEKAESKGLVLQPGNQKNANWFCVCCSDCCEILTSAQKLEKPAQLFATNYYSEVDRDLCSACGTCSDRCPMFAITIEEIAQVNLDRCIGCGVCVTGCPEEAISLKNKEKIIEPPENINEMYGKIIANKSNAQ